MLIQCRRRWIDVKPTLIQRFVSAGLEQQLQYTVTTYLLAVRIM